MPVDEGCILPVERGDLQLLVKCGDKRGDQEDERPHLERGRGNLCTADRNGIQPCVDDLAHEHHIGIEMGIACVFADENDGECKEQGEDDADRVVVFDKACLAEQFDE